jgi:hypothetical protein
MAMDGDITIDGSGRASYRFKSPRHQRGRKQGEERVGWSCVGASVALTSPGMTTGPKGETAVKLGRGGTRPSTHATRFGWLSRPLILGSHYHMLPPRKAYRALLSL